MSPDLRPPGDVPFAHTLGPRQVEGASALARIRATMRASPWASLAGRAVVLAFGLFVLAWIGRAATAVAKRETSAAIDAGVVPTAVLAQLPPVMSGSPSPALPSLASPPPASPSSASPSPPAAPSPPPSAPSSSHARATPEDPVFINVASAEELRRLPGVGPKRAEAIVALRRRMGKFQRVEDLLRVKGVGRTTLRKWRPLLRLDAPAAADGGASTAPESAASEASVRGP